MITGLKPGKELTRAFDELLLARYYATGKKGHRQNLSNGDPLSTAFRPIIQAVSKAIHASEMAIYTRGGGPKAYRDTVLPFCESLGISPLEDTLTHRNITFGIGSTYLYSTILKILAQEESKRNPELRPVLLMPAPTYGIFAAQPVQNNFEIETFSLKEEDGWQINPAIMDQRISDINRQEGRRVVALYHANPHNPTGAVSDYAQGLNIVRILKKHDVFAIDDMAYAGIEHARKAVPLSVHDFNRCASLFTLSKAYCMPRARSGFACAPKWLIEKIDEYTDTNMISMPAAVFSAASACFSEENKQLRDEKYLPQNSKKYLAHFEIMKAMIYGIESLTYLTKERKEEIVKIVSNAFGNLPEATNILKEGIPSIRIMNDQPEAGYFSMIQIQGLDTMFYGTERLKDSFDFAVAAVDIGRVLSLPLGFALASDTCGDSLRISFGGMQEQTLVRAIRGIKRTLDNLTSQPNEDQQALKRSIDSKLSLQR